MLMACTIHHSPYSIHRAPYRYEGCWRAIMSECDGVVLVYNPDAPAQDQQLNDWYDMDIPYTCTTMHTRIHLYINIHTLTHTYTRTYIYTYTYTNKGSTFSCARTV
ncbi:hypothetical protein EON63_15890 [archaeon]|nr:MAG: hypothetical protein EON63_15890 [archaeon]